jgi:hypothetical protein
MAATRRVREGDAGVEHRILSVGDAWKRRGHDDRKRE